MGEQNFDININDQSVNVRLYAVPGERFRAFILFLGIGTLLMCGLIFAPGKQGRPSMWHDLSSSPIDSGDFIIPISLLLSFPILMGFLLRRYVISAYPSDETLHCDRQTLTISRVRWFDIHDKRWDTSSYPLANVVNVRYQRIASARGTSIYGLRFIAEDRTQRVLPGLEARDADKILKALKAFGADVPDDPTLSSKCKTPEETSLVDLG